MAAPSLDALAEELAERGVVSVFVYTNEAHPGEHFPHLTSMEQKFEHAAALRDRIGVRRPILVDALDGACHRAYGSMPNMTWIINRRGIPVYKADWADVDSVRAALEHQLDLPRRRRAGERLRPFKVEQLGYRHSDLDGFLEGLERSGPKAVREYRQAFGV